MKSERMVVRRRSGLTQIELSRLSGVSSSRISLWENGQLKLKGSEVEAIGRVVHHRLSHTPRLNLRETVRTLSRETEKIGEEHHA